MSDWLVPLKCEKPVSIMFPVLEYVRFCMGLLANAINKREQTGQWKVHIHNNMLNPYYKIQSLNKNS